VLKTKGSKIYFDFDDAIYSYSKAKFDCMMLYADKIIVATPFLKDIIASYNKTVVVIFSPVDTELIVAGRSIQSIFTIGWIGSPWTIHYLGSLEKVLYTIALKFNYKLLIVGAEMKLEGLNIECVSWSEENEIEALGKIDVGIMPLDDDEWAKMKGGYKLYLYMAAGKPVVASPYGINSFIVQEGTNGYLAQTEEQWANALELLYINAGLRDNLGSAARISAIEHYSYDVCTPQLKQIIK